MAAHSLDNPPWRLLKFPEGYTLYIHKSGVMTDRGNPRTDAYLYGAPHLGPSTGRAQSGLTVFRSPTEFVPHAIWLMRGSPPGQCDCKYCIPGQNQKDINRRLNHGADVESDDDDDDDGGGNSGMVQIGSNRIDSSNFLLSLSLFVRVSAAARRNRGANATGTARPRRARRDRTPPINLDIAKDYRDRVPQPGPSSAT